MVTFKIDLKKVSLSNSGYKFNSTTSTISLHNTSFNTQTTISFDDVFTIVNKKNIRFIDGMDKKYYIKQKIEITPSNISTKFTVGEEFYYKIRAANLESGRIRFGEYTSILRGVLPKEPVTESECSKKTPQKSFEYYNEKNQKSMIDFVISDASGKIDPNFRGFNLTSDLISQDCISQNNFQKDQFCRKKYNYKNSFDLGDKYIFTEQSDTETLPQKYIIKGPSNYGWNDKINCDNDGKNCKGGFSCIPPEISKLKPNIPNIIILYDSSNNPYLGIDYNIPKDIPILPEGDDRREKYFDFIYKGSKLDNKKEFDDFLDKEININNPTLQPTTRRENMCDTLKSINNCSEGICTGGNTKRAPHYYVIAYWETNKNDSIKLNTKVKPDVNSINNITVDGKPIVPKYIKTPEGSVLIPATDFRTLIDINNIDLSQATDYLFSVWAILLDHTSQSEDTKFNIFKIDDKNNIETDDEGNKKIHQAIPDEFNLLTKNVCTDISDIQKSKYSDWKNVSFLRSRPTLISYKSSYKAPAGIINLRIVIINSPNFYLELVNNKITPIKKNLLIISRLKLGLEYQLINKYWRV